MSSRFAEVMLRAGLEGWRCGFGGGCCWASGLEMVDGVGVTGLLVGWGWVKMGMTMLLLLLLLVEVGAVVGWLAGCWRKLVGGAPAGLWLTASGWRGWTVLVCGIGCAAGGVKVHGCRAGLGLTSSGSRGWRVLLWVTGSSGGVVTAVQGP